MENLMNGANVLLAFLLGACHIAMWRLLRHNRQLAERNEAQAQTITGLQKRLSSWETTGKPVLVPPRGLWSERPRDHDAKFEDLIRRIDEVEREQLAHRSRDGAD